MVNPELLQIGIFHIRWYGVMVACGVLAGYWLQLRRVSKYNLTKNDASDLTFWAMIGALAGARLLYVHRFWEDEFADDIMSAFRVWEGGLVFLGGLAGAALVVCCLCWIKQWQLWRAADLLAPALALGQAFGRIGCLMNGCCYGFKYAGPCCVRYGYPDWTCFPLQGIASVGNLIFCLLLLWLEKHGKCRKYLFFVYMMIYCAGRFLLEFGRGDYPEEQLFIGLTPAQVTCLWLGPVLCVVYGIFHIVSKRLPKGKKN